jgi:hypothetical protein
MNESNDAPLQKVLQLNAEACGEAASPRGQEVPALAALPVENFQPEQWRYQNERQRGGH